MKKTSSLLLALFALAGSLPSPAQPIVTNCTTCIYAVVRDPLALSFGVDGALYCGRDNSGSGGGSADAVRIHRVSPGGDFVAEFSASVIPDPDAVIVDTVGAISGAAGAVLVGGQSSPGIGKVSRVAPDGTVTDLFGPSSLYSNPSAFTFDSAGRLLFSDAAGGRVYRTDGGTPVLLFSLTDAFALATDAADRIVVSLANSGRLLLYTASGALSNANLAVVRAGCPLVRGPSGAWTTDIYAIDASGFLLRLALDGSITRVGSGFANIEGLTFGPDGALYASDFNGDRVYRFAQPAVPGAVTTVYARVTDPVRLSFAPDGTLFVGRDNTGSGGDWDDAVKIHQIGPGGAPVEEYGNAAITDPDAVVFDADGSASGIPGAVLVAGHELNSAPGKIVAIRPDQTLTTLYGPTAFTFNPNVCAYDLNGRLLFSDDEGGKVWTMTNGTPTVLFNLVQALHLAADTLNRLVVGVSGTPTLRLYSPTGSLLTDAFATIAADSPLARGPGGFWGTRLFCVNTNGDLLALDLDGAATKFGTGFGAPWAMAFGPDGALYVSDFNSDLIWRLAPANLLRLVGAATVGKNFSFSFQTVSNLSYTVEYKDDLRTTNWLFHHSLIGDGLLMPCLVPMTNAPQRFFRVLQP